MAARLIIFLLFFFGCPLLAQAKLTDDEVGRLWDRLSAPEAHVRAEAAFALQEYVKEDDIKLLLFGKEIQYKDITRKIEPDIQALAILLSGGWPEAADKYLKEIYEVKGQFAPAIGWMLFKHKKLDYINQDLETTEPWMRNDYYDDYINRMSDSVIWRDKYLYLASKPWLKARYLADKRVALGSKLLVRILNREKVSDEEIKESKWLWLLDLKTSLETNEPPPFNTNYLTTPFGRISYPELICMLMDKPDWLQNYQEQLSKCNVKIFTFFGAMKNTVADLRNPLISIIMLLRDDKIEEAKKLLEPIVMNEDSNRIDCRIDNRMFLHHPWFSKLRASDGFAEWWRDFTTTQIKDADPEFKTVDWREP